MEKEIENLKALKALDLNECKSVGDIVSAMKLCSFGARMLGEAAETISKWIGKNSIIIYDECPHNHLGGELQYMVERGWFRKIIQSNDYPNEERLHDNILVVGNIGAKGRAIIFNTPADSIFVNQYGFTKHGYRDGYYSNLVVCDPNIAIPILATALYEKMDNKSVLVYDLFVGLARFEGIAQSTVKGAETIKDMIEDKDCTVFLTISGAMTIAKMGLIIADMIDNGYVDCVTTTGALICHNLVENSGLKHYKYDPQWSDVELAKRKLNRVTDTLEPEENLSRVDQVVNEVLDNIDGRYPISPSALFYRIGQHLETNYPNERGILKSAFRRNIPVLIPAFVDSELGNDIFVHNRKREREGKPPIVIDMEADTKKLIELATSRKKNGIFTIGGGVPRNFTQNVAPLIELLNDRLGFNLPLGQFFYGVRIAPDPSYYGHLSGCTYSEGKSWRKMDVGGRFSQIRADATIILPFLAKYLMEMVRK